MVKNLLDYEVDNALEWSPLKRLADAVIDRAINDLALSLDWLWNYENSNKLYKKKKSTKAKLHPTINSLNHAYLFLTSEQVTILSNHETSGAVMCEKINNALFEKYPREFCLKYIEMVEYL